MAVVVLDTDVISGLIKENLSTGLNAKLVGHQLITTFVTAAELERWVVQRELGARRKAEIEVWISGPILSRWRPSTSGTSTTSKSRRDCSSSRRRAWVEARSPWRRRPAGGGPAGASVAAPC